ncbi:stonustoxin subunit alpha-like isoform X2 [Ahaetulla prasina]|nr:stonustoxin subunit alpha-like isoform X2 [Ahaetulla prasina]
MARTQDTIETSALGRPFQLGMLYDWVTLWDYSSLQKDLTIKPQPKTESEIIASDSIDDKSSALDISASLKVSFLGGLIEVGGSAKYLQDKKKSKQQARVTVQYKTTTKYEQLTMRHLGIQNVSYPAVFEHGTATHVVTAILYGAQAFFVFDREVSSTESVKDIQGTLQLTVKNLISITGEAEVKLTEKEKENAQKFSCKFHGNFSLEKNPVTFQDAMNIYETLPKLLGEHGEKAVPMRVWLYPLTKLDNRAAKLVREISLTLIFDAEKILEELNEIQMQSNDLIKNRMAETFPEIKRKIRQFKDLCKQHRQTFQKQLARVLPSIRGGGQEEGTLVDILMSVNQSPFNSQRLHEFLDTKKREMNFVQSYLTILSQMQVISSQNELEEIVLNPQNVYVVSFIFTSLHKKEPFLLSLQDWLQEQFLQESANSTRSSPGQKEDMAWFEDKGWTRNARRAAKSIKDFFSVNQSNEKVRFVVASLPDVDNPVASIYLYEDGELVSKNFELPSKPLPLLISELRHDSIQLKFQPAEHGKATISSYLVEYKVAGEENWKTARTEDAGEMFLLKDLPPNTEYQLQYAACCKPGLSKRSDLSPPIKTLPTSPPEKLRMVTAASSVISVAWMSPSIVASGVVVKEYKVEYRMAEAEAGKDQWTEKRTGRKTEFYPIEGLKPQRMYRVRVSAVCDNRALSAPSEEVAVSTSLEEEDGGNIAHQFPVEGAESWQILYFLHNKKRNLVKNPNGEEGLQHWKDVQNGGDGWKVEELPGDSGKDFPREEVHTYFVSSFGWCSKSQIIDLQAEGYWEELMDTTQPKIVVKDWYAGRCDAGCLYHLKVKLLSAKKDVVAEFKSETISVPLDKEGEWAEVTHTFADYGPGVRFVHFEHSGKDTVVWKGWYGARVTSSTVTVEP